MPGNGILHQINLEKFSPVVQVKGGVAFVDTLVGTDSHTTMINALGVLGWGVGGIEAESVMLGRPIWMRLPKIIGIELTGRPRPGIQATDIVLALTEYLRGQGVVGAILEFHGQGAFGLPLADRATIANMSPEFGATASLFAIDARTIEYLKLTGRGEVADRVESYARAQGLWADTLAKAESAVSLQPPLRLVGDPPPIAPRRRYNSTLSYPRAQNVCGSSMIRIGINHASPNLFFAITRPTSIASIRLSSFARPSPALPNAVPWSTDERMIGSPIVQLTPLMDE
jgi:hypothetical protein